MKRILFVVIGLAISFGHMPEVGHWEMAQQWLTERYIQHNPNAASGRAAVVT